MTTHYSASSTSTARWFLRVSLAFVFAYAGIAGLTAPSSWVGYLPSFVSAVADPTSVLVVWSVGELGVAVWLLSGWKSWYAGLVSAVLLFAVVVFNTAQMAVLFRDLGLAGAALALMVLTESNPKADFNEQ